MRDLGVKILLRWSSTATAQVIQVDGLEGRVTDGWPKFELKLCHGSARAVAGQDKIIFVAAGGVRIPAIVVPPSASFYSCTVTCKERW